ncbi:MAG: DUF1178 family protein [Betaproteobacteria bacterium]|nr:DUF1178 family protein [Betaproteobacteria bacterium]
MIIFDLRCSHGHSFEGWFASGDEFSRQQANNLVRCPVCDDATVARLPSAKVRVSKSAVVVREPPPAPPSEAIAGLSPELLAKMREVVRNTENVGARFPEEARKIHYNEVPARAIRGQASRDEAQALTEEGIEFASLPAFLSQDSN